MEIELIVINAGVATPTAVPKEVSRRQALQALVIAGLDEEVQTILDSIEDDTERKLAKVEWEASLTFKRDWPLVVGMGDKLGLTPAQLDDLFIFAATLD